MNSGLAFWGPFLVIFGTAVVISVAQRYARDICLMRFDGDYVIVLLRNGRWLWGLLDVHSKALEVIYAHPPRTTAGDEHLTYVLYEQNLGDVLLLLRPEPGTGSPAYADWVLNMQKLRHPPLLHRMKRDLRNLFNMLRNAFSESIAVVVGIVKQRTSVGRIAGADQKATEAGQKLLTTIPASYEPILEHYRSHEVAIESLLDPANPAAGAIERIGVLEEYSDKFILLRDAPPGAEIPPDALRPEDASDRFAIIVPRTNSFVRHLARRRKPTIMATAEKVLPLTR